MNGGIPNVVKAKEGYSFPENEFFLRNKYCYITAETLHLCICNDLFVDLIFLLH